MPSVSGLPPRKVGAVSAGAVQGPAGRRARVPPCGALAPLALDSSLIGQKFPPPPQEVGFPLASPGHVSPSLPAPSLWGLETPGGSNRSGEDPGRDHVRPCGAAGGGSGTRVGRGRGSRACIPPGTRGASRAGSRRSGPGRALLQRFGGPPTGRRVAGRRARCPLRLPSGSSRRARQARKRVSVGSCLDVRGEGWRRRGRRGEVRTGERAEVGLRRNFLIRRRDAGWGAGAVF